MDQEDARAKVIEILSPDKRMSYHRLRNIFYDVAGVYRGLSEALASLVEDGSVVILLEDRIPSYELSTADGYRQNRIIPSGGVERLYPGVTNKQPWKNFG